VFQGQARQDGGGQDPVDQGDPALGGQHRVAQRGAGTGLAVGHPPQELIDLHRNG